jgi:hypothetical protein
MSVLRLNGLCYLFAERVKECRPAVNRRRRNLQIKGTFAPSALLRRSVKGLLVDVYLDQSGRSTTGRLKHWRRTEQENRVIELTCGPFPFNQ